MCTCSEKSIADTLKTVLEKHGRGRDSLIPILQDVQKETGYISQEAVAAISRYLRLSENDIFGVSSFYAQFRFTAPGRNSVKVCLGTACHVKGGSNLLDTLKAELGVDCGETTPDNRYDLERVACLGCCAQAPVVQVNDKIFSKMTVNNLTELLKNYE